MTIKESRSSLVKKKRRRKSIRMLCNGGMVLAIATGIWFGSAVQAPESIQVASVGNAVQTPVMEQEPEVQKPEQQKPEQQEVTAEPVVENTNPYHIDPNKPMIALTFDDGPSKHTWTIVDALKAHNARATFFLLGNRVSTHQAAIDYILDNHNEIGSHSVAHKNLAKISTESELIAQIRPVDEIMQSQHGYAIKLFRVPYGSKNDQVQQVLKAEGKIMVGWSVDPCDWKVRDKQKVVDHILNTVKDGDIILMHDIYESTAEAVVELVPALQAQGYQLVTVSELLQFRGVTPQAGDQYYSVPMQKAA